MEKTVSTTLWGHLYRFIIGGVDFHLDGNGGDECVNYISIWQRLIETVFFGWIAISGIKYSIKNIKKQRNNEFYMYSPTPTPMDPFIMNDIEMIDKLDFSPISISTTSSEYSTPLMEYPLIIPGTVVSNLGNWRLSLHSTIITLYCLIFGGELAFKLISGTAIFLLNPCHLTTIIQLYLLVFPTNNSFTKWIFRIHTYTLAGALIAILFPILNTRNLHGEQFIYFAQHLFILLIPFYLFYLGEPFTQETLFEFNWAILGYSILALYHLFVLQIIGLITKVNLNCIICPGVSDPFASRGWRIIAFTHQAIAVPLVSKIYCYISMIIINFIKNYNFKNKNNFRNNDESSEKHTKIE
ncbi:Transmembrane protein 164 [Strongyloides ratti]|uniref:Transmembrane protein 164 n=1 Tax=Strongyloides ratti TaxID=34506 RepID=A0A090MZV6_STRRB|nr:Transmembrane protein 164 [Strongyloides ratti]CEF69600.1 Transmembrane protein 164 [Strongyloides ratti]